MKVDSKGNVYSSGPGGIWVIAPDGKHLGTIRTPESVTNLAFGETTPREDALYYGTSYDLQIFLVPKSLGG